MILYSVIFKWCIGEWENLTSPIDFSFNAESLEWRRFLKKATSVNHTVCLWMRDKWWNSFVPLIDGSWRNVDNKYFLIKKYARTHFTRRRKTTVHDSCFSRPQSYHRTVIFRRIRNFVELVVYVPIIAFRDLLYRAEEKSSSRPSCKLATLTVSFGRLSTVRNQNHYPLMQDWFRSLNTFVPASAVTTF